MFHFIFCGWELVISARLPLQQAHEILLSLPPPALVLGLQKHLVFTWVLTLVQTSLSPLSSPQPLSFSDILSINCLQVSFCYFVEQYRTYLSDIEASYIYFACYYHLTCLIHNYRRKWELCFIKWQPPLPSKTRPNCQVTSMPLETTLLLYSGLLYPVVSMLVVYSVDYCFLLRITKGEGREREGTWRKGRGGGKRAAIVGFWITCNYYNDTLLDMLMLYMITKSFLHTLKSLIRITSS